MSEAAATTPLPKDDWAGFMLSDGVYEPLPLDEQGRLISPLLQLVLVRWQGVFQDVEATWLREDGVRSFLFPMLG